MVFRIRKKPQRPKRKTITDSFWINTCLHGVSLDAIEFHLRQQVKVQIEQNVYYQKIGLDLADYSNLRLKEDSDWDDYSLYVLGDRQETDLEFNERLNAYKRNLKKYNKWYAENKNNIAAELDRREKEKENKKEREAEAKEKQIKKLEAELKKLRNA